MARCQKPINIRNPKTREGLLVPCGKCENCRKTRASNWSFRLLQEDRVSSSSYFVTLTYDVDNVPLSKRGYMDLCKRDLQLFFKKLRKLHCKKGVHGLRYFAVGEYGGKYSRPHYHIILFNAALELLTDSKFALAVKRGFIELDGESPITCKVWDKGHITVGQVSGASVGYTLKYVVKPGKVPMHKNDDRKIEFAVMSKGLGENYVYSKPAVNHTIRCLDVTVQAIGLPRRWVLRKYVSYRKTYLVKAPVLSNSSFWHRQDMEKRLYCTVEDGKKLSLPRYYKLRMYHSQEMEIIRAFGALEQLKGRTYEGSARSRSEAFYAGIDRMQNNVSYGQKM